MRLMPKIISAGFATCALASASLPAVSWNVSLADAGFHTAAAPVAPSADAVVANDETLASVMELMAKL